jgi:16S rRNA G966 N2-methylase RsmD
MATVPLSQTHGKQTAPATSHGVQQSLVPPLPPISPDLRLRLKEDISRRGILVPILISQDGDCLDGRLRLEIAEELGLPARAVPKIVVGRISAAERADLRLVLNLYRRQLTQAQVRELIAWELRRQPQASDRAVAQRIGVDHKTVGGVRRALESIGEIPRCHARQTSDGRQYTSTRKPIVITTSNAQAVEAQRLLDELGEDAPSEFMNVKKLRRIKSARDRADYFDKITSETSPRFNSDFLIHHCDFRNLKDRIAPGSVDLAVCDPPWGEEFAPQRKALAETVFRLLKADGIFACYTGVAHLPAFLDSFRAAGLTYGWTVVAKRQVSSVRQRNKIINRWVPIVIFSKGHLNFNSVLNDTLEETEPDKTLHAWQQPVGEAVTLIQALSRPGATVCDLLAGSGTTAVATIEVGGGRRFVGCESDERLVKAARCRVAEALRQFGQVGKTSRGRA